MRRKLSLVFTVLFVGIVVYSGCSLILEASESKSEVPTGIAWLSGWSYRKAHNITGSVAAEQRNYPITIVIHYDNGSDSGGHAYLKGKCRSDFGDIRFTDINGDGLNYWIQQKTDAVSAVFWIEIGLIPQYPLSTIIYMYYGNPNASTTSNEHWTFDLVSDFEDNMTEGWIFSSPFLTVWDGIADQQVYQGNYCRGAQRIYGDGGAGNGDFYERFSDQNGIYLASGSYWLQGTARFEREDNYVKPQATSLDCSGVVVASTNTPHASWNTLQGNLTVSEDSWVNLSFEFHLYATSDLHYGSEGYYIDSIILRRRCFPEPIHAAWDVEDESSNDNVSPQISSIEWVPTAPYPFVPTSTPRNGELVVVYANATDDGGSGIDVVQLSYREDGGSWCNASMVWNASGGLWEASIPGYPGGCSVEFFVTCRDLAGNVAVGEMHGYVVRSLLAGDVDGDGDVDIYDIVRAAVNYGKGP